MAYVLGFFAADGYITVNRRGGCYWCLNITDKELLYMIRDCVNSDHAISVRTWSGKGKMVYRLQIGSIELCEDLRKLGFWANKTYSLSIPFVPGEFFSHFVRGYFDGDGNVWKGLVHKGTAHAAYTLRTAFSSCSRNFLEHLQDRLVALLGVSGSVSPTKRACFRLSFAREDSLKLYNFMYNGLTSPLFLERKRVVFEKFKEMRS